MSPFTLLLILALAVSAPMASAKASGHPAPQILFKPGQPSGTIDVLDALEGAESLQTLHSSLDALLKHNFLAVEVHGFADASECRGEACETLALERASRVRDWLVRKGVSANRITTTGFGTSRPWKPGHSAYNRRVEISTVVKPAPADK